MRIWNAENSALPPSAVLEQDFILRLRRLKRLGLAHRIANVRLGALWDKTEKQERAALYAHLEQGAQNQGGTCAAMSNGDVFLLWPEAEGADVFLPNLLNTLLPEEEERTRSVDVFLLPRDYTLLREKADHYLALARERQEQGTTQDDPTVLLQSARARGPLTPWSLDLIDSLVDTVDLAPFVRSQTAYSYEENEGWHPLFEETFIGLEEVKQAFFPHTDPQNPRPLFLNLCKRLDDHLLTFLATRPSKARGTTRLTINLALTSILGSTFAAFAHSLSQTERALFGFEIDCSDLTQDFAQTLDVLTALKEEGFSFIIDGVPPAMAGFFRFEKLEPDFIKIKASNTDLHALGEESFREALATLPSEKIIFSHCEEPRALHLGLSLGLRRFQGRLIDIKATKAPNLIF